MDNNDDNLNPMPTEAPVETPTETPAPEAPIDIETTDEPALADAPVETPAEETPAEPEAPAEETPVEETPAEPEAPAETPAEEAPAETPIEETAPIEPSIPVETPAEPTEPVIESAPIDMAAPVAPAETPKKKSKAGLIIAAIALIVILSGAIIAMLIISNSPTTPNKGGNNSNNNSNGNNSQVVEEEEEEVALESGSDADQKTDDIMRYILAKPGNGTFSPVDTVYSEVLSYFKNEDQTSAKLFNIVHYMVQITRDEEAAGATTFTYAKKIDSKDYPASEDLSKYYGQFQTREEFLNGTLQISADAVADLYFKAFGEEPEHKSTNGCDTLYDAKRKVYYYGPLSACGGAAINELLITPISKSKKNNQYYADYYVTYGVGSFNDSTYELYAGATTETGLLRTFKSHEDFEACNATIISENSCLTKEEKAKVKTYRFVFEKDGDDLHFKEVVEKK